MSNVDSGLFSSFPFESGQLIKLTDCLGKVHAGRLIERIMDLVIVETSKQVGQRKLIYFNMENIDHVDPVPDNAVGGSSDSNDAVFCGGTDDSADGRDDAGSNERESDSTYDAGSLNGIISVFGWTPTNIDLPELERFRQKEIKRVAVLRAMEKSGVSDRGLKTFNALAKLFGSEIVRWEENGQIVVNNLIRVGEPYTSEDCTTCDKDTEKTDKVSKDTLFRVKRILQRSCNT